MLLVSNAVSFLLILNWNFAFQKINHQRSSHIPLSGYDNHELHRYRASFSGLSMTPIFDSEFYRNSPSSPTDLNPAHVFLSLLESQLAIIVQCTNITHAAIYMSSENDELRDDDEPVMQLVCSYPPTPQSRENDPSKNVRSRRGDYIKASDGVQNNEAEDDYDGKERERQVGSTSTSTSSTPKRAPIRTSNTTSDRRTQDAFDVSSTVEDSNADSEDSEVYIEDVVDSEWSDLGGEPMSMVYPIQYQGLNLGILQTIINKEYQSGEGSQNIPMFDFYDFQSCTSSSSWNPYKTDRRCVMLVVFWNYSLNIVYAVL
jgi:hypothetical protein